MSERQAKMNRKAAKQEQDHAPKKSKGGIITNIAAIVVVLAIAGAGGYASWNKISQSRPAASESQDVQDMQQPQTVADIAEEKGTTADELLEKLGLSEELNADSSASELFSKLTIESYAKYEDKTTAEIKEEYGIKALADDTLWQEAQMQVPMGKMAEMGGQSFEDFAAQAGLPEEITADTTYEEAIAIMQKAQMEEETNQEEEDGEEAETETTEE